MQCVIIKIKGVKAINSFVSVIISNYNYAQYLSEAIESVLTQTYQHFEVIVVDDGSTDRSAEVINKYKTLYPNKVKAIFKENGGQGSAFNAGFEVAKGDIIAFLDADDYWYENKLEIIVEYHQEYDGIQHNLLVNNQERLTYLEHLKEKQHRALVEFGFLGVIPTSGLSFKKEKLDIIFPMPEKDFKICADGYVKNKFLLENDILSIDTPLGMYRVHGSNNWYSNKSVAKPFIEKTLNYLNIDRNKKNSKMIPYKSGGISFSNYFFESLKLEPFKTYVLFGTGLMGKIFYYHMEKKYNIVGFASSINNVEAYLDLPVFSIDELQNKVAEVDYIVIASESMVEIVDSLVESGIPKEKIKHPEL